MAGTKLEKEWINAKISEVGKNLIIDELFKHWLEYDSVVDPASNDYGHTLGQVVHAKASGTRPTMTIAKETLALGELEKGNTALKISASAGDTSLDATSYYIACRHWIFQGTRHNADGQKIIVGLKAKSSVDAQKIGIVARQYYGSGGSPSATEILTGEIFTLGTAFGEYSHIFTTNSLTGKTFGDNNDDAIVIDIIVQCGSTVATSLFSGSAFGFTEAVDISVSEFRAFQGDVLYDSAYDPDTLEKIEQFYFIYQGGTSSQAIRSHYVYTNEAKFVFQRELSLMKFTPSCALRGTANNTGGHYVGDYNGGGIVTGWSFSVVPINHYGFHVTATKTSHGKTELILTMHYNDGITVDGRY